MVGTFFILVILVDTVVLTRVIRLMAITDPNIKIPIILEMVYPVAWLEEKAEGDPEGRTNREVQTKVRTPHHTTFPVTQKCHFILFSITTAVSK